MTQPNIVNCKIYIQNHINMKAQLLLSAIAFGAALVATGCKSAPADRYIVEGTIDNAPDGYQAVMFDTEHRDGISDTAMIRNGRFRFEGVVEAPTICEVRIESPDKEERDRAFAFMLDNGVTEIYAPAVDSIPAGWYTGGEQKMLEKCVKIKGGKAQTEYQEYCDYMFPYELAEKVAHKNAYWRDGRGESSEEEQEVYVKALEDANNAASAARVDFVNKYPGYNISMKLLAEQLDAPFSYSNEQLDNMLAVTGPSEWTARRDKLVDRIEKYRGVVALTPYIDVDLLMVKGDTVKLSDYVGRGNYVFIDFWASWCSPCRAAIPHVKKIHEQYPEGLTILSVSLDSDKASWDNAVEQEDMSWTQLWAPDELGKAAGQAYRFASIPTLVLIDKDGRIALESHEPSAIDAYLESNL